MQDDLTPLDHVPELGDGPLLALPGGREPDGYVRDLAVGPAVWDVVLPKVGIDSTQATDETVPRSLHLYRYLGLVVVRPELGQLISEGDGVHAPVPHGYLLMVVAIDDM